MFQDQTYRITQMSHVYIQCSTRFIRIVVMDQKCLELVRYQADQAVLAVVVVGLFKHLIINIMSSRGVQNPARGGRSVENGRGGRHGYGVAGAGEARVRGNVGESWRRLDGGKNVGRAVEGLNWLKRLKGLKGLKGFGSESWEGRRFLSEGWSL